MITVWTACTGEAYDLEEVHILHRQVKRHLTVPFIFCCLTEYEIPHMSVKPIKFLPGWWIKTTLFGPTVSHTRNLWLDLDVTISDNINGLVERLGSSQIRIAKNWAQSGHGGCQSSVMYWEGDSAAIIDRDFKAEWAHWPPRNDLHWDNGQVQWGDQEWITYLRDTGQLKVSYFNKEDVVSYKYHCRQGLPPGSKIQVFHGKPDPKDVNDPWVLQCRS